MAGDDPRGRDVEGDHHRRRADALLAAGLADHHQGLAVQHRVRDAVEGCDGVTSDAKLDVDVVECEEGCGHGAHRSFGSNASRNASPRRMKARTVMLRNSAGKNSMCGYCSRYPCATESCSPQEIAGRR